MHLLFGTIANKVKATSGKYVFSPMVYKKLNWGNVKFFPDYGRHQQLSD